MSTPEQGGELVDADPDDDELLTPDDAPSSPPADDVDGQDVGEVVSAPDAG